MTGNELRSLRFMRELYEWPKRDGMRSVGGHMWDFKGDRAISGNLIIMRQQWQKEHYREAASA